MTVYSPLASPSATIAELQRWGLHTKKGLGQHLLVDDGVIGRIIRLADPVSALPVLEIGPGIGTLTEALLLQGADVLSVEIDERLKPLLDDLHHRYQEHFTFFINDALLLNEPDLPPRFAIVANLPYRVAATIVLDAFQRFSGLQRATVMMQREVAERIMASPGSKAYGAFTVKLALLAEAVGSFAVARSSFLPPPRVDSTVLRLERIDGQRLQQAGYWEHARSIIDAAFAERRKTLRNSLRSSLAGYEATEIDEALAAAGIDGRRRAESLAVAEFPAFLSAFAAIAASKSSILSYID